MEARFAIAARHSRIVRALRVAVPAAVLDLLASSSALRDKVMTNAGNIVREQMEQYRAFAPKQVYFTGARFMSRESGRGAVQDAQRIFYSSLRSEGVDKPDFITATDIGMSP